MIFQNLKEKNDRKAVLIYSATIICFYLYIFVLFVIGWDYFQFPSNGVEGPGNEFIPIFRMFLMVFIFMIPFIGLLTYIGYSFNENTNNLSLRINQITEMIPFYLEWAILWPGLFFVLGYFGNILGIIFNASEPLSPYWNGYWIVFLVVGRILDVVQVKYLEKTNRIESVERNVFLQFIVYFSIDIGIIFVTILLQLIAFLGSFVIVAPFILVIQSFNYDAPWIIGVIPGAILILAWPILSSSAYVFCLFLRGRLRKILLHPSEIFKEDFTAIKKNEKEKVIN